MREMGSQGGKEKGGKAYRVVGGESRGAAGQRPEVVRHTPLSELKRHHVAALRFYMLTDSVCTPHFLSLFFYGKAMSSLREKLQHQHTHNGVFRNGFFFCISLRGNLDSGMERRLRLQGSWAMVKG